MDQQRDDRSARFVGRDALVAQLRRTRTRVFASFRRQRRRMGAKGRLVKFDLLQIYEKEKGVSSSRERERGDLPSGRCCC